eukprot:SAG11_NODE_1617_length_4575_cov_7.041332_3_plen_151_part_00
MSLLQANYSAAKGAVTTLAQTLGAEGHRDGVLVNAVATGGLTRMTAKLGTHDNLLPEHTAFGVVSLCHERCTDTAEFFRAEGGRIFKLRWQANAGMTFNPPPDGAVGAVSEGVLHEIRDRWAEVGDFDDGTTWYPQAERQARWRNSTPKL